MRGRSASICSAQRSFSQPPIVRHRFRHESETTSRVGVNLQWRQRTRNGGRGTLGSFLGSIIGWRGAFCGAHRAIAAPLLGIWGLIGTAAPAGWWAWLARSLPEDAEPSRGHMVAVIQLATTIGAVIDGALLAVIRRRLEPAPSSY